MPPVTRALIGVLVFQSLLSAAIRYRQWTEKAHIVIPYLTLVPQLSLVYPWTFVTSTLVEGNVFTLAMAGMTLYHGGRYLERAWSSAELAKFMALVSLVPTALTFCVMVLLFTLTRDESWTWVPVPPICCCCCRRGPGQTADVWAGEAASPSSRAPFPCKSPSSSPLASSCRRTR